MLFWLKKTISFWLMPLPFCVLLFAAGAWLLRGSRQHRLGKALMGTSALLLILGSNSFITESIVRPLELRYPAIPEFSEQAAVPADFLQCRYVVILGGGNGNGAHRPALSQLSNSALARLTEGVRVLRALPDARLLVSGPGDGEQFTHADRLARAAISLGVAPDRITKIETAHDTEEEAAATRRIAGRATVAVVTSAWHMPRAMALFRDAGLHAVPCPTDYLLKSNAGGWRSGFSWNAENLADTTWAMHEWLGQLWLWLRGKI